MVLAASHLHSKWSYDAQWSLDDLRDHLRRRGYQILLMTEHDRGFTASRYQEYREACVQATTNDVLVMPGIEYSDKQNRVHVLVWGTPFLGEGLPTTELLNAVSAHNGIAVLAHPSRKEAWRSFEPVWGELVIGIEIWNRKYDGWSPSLTAPDLVRRTDAIEFVGLDFHTQKQSFPLAMALDLNGTPTEAAVLESFRLRRCQARAFGMPIDQDRLKKAFVALNVAERGRRVAASIARKTRVFASR